MRSRVVLVTDGDERAALAIVRALGHAGHVVHVCSRSGASIAGASRWCAGENAVRDPLADPAGFGEDVRRLCAALAVDTLLPVSEASLLALLPADSRCPGVLIPFADLETFRAVSNKRLVLDAAARIGIAVPAQHTIDSYATRHALTAASLTYPVVLKPARSVGAQDGGPRLKAGVRHAADAMEFARQLATFTPSAYPLLIQQRIVGPGIGIFLLLWEGRTHAVFSHRRIREKPPSGGVSVYRESIPADPALVDRSRALLESFAWRGVAMIEFKVEESTGTRYLMEINGRFWGSLQLALDAGVDFPSLLISAASGGAPPPTTGAYRTGVRSRWWWGDVDHLVARLRRSEAELAMPPGSPSRWRALLDFLMLWRPGDRAEINRPGDLAPFWRESLNWLRGR